MSSMARATSPGPITASNAVEHTQAKVVAASRRFFAARRSAKAPSAGMANITSAYETESAAVQAKAAHGALPATTPAK